ncbi:helix-turn-helix domain-containing protein [Chitinophaga sp. RCC_12]|uniref:helix-turn-helix domain-containing protein n=1 Tax=Chitinophaga sp. RCC_12 TaxID=3239226 RepID=UPI00352321CA
MERLFQTVILLGVVQGFIASGLLFFSTRKRVANRFLAGLIFLLSMASFCLCGSYYHWFDVPLLNLLSQLLPLIVIMPVGPLMYFYIQSFCDPEFTLTRQRRRHFWPVVIDLGAPVAAIVFVAGVLTGVLKNNPQPWGIFIDTYNVYSDIPRWISLAIYTGLSFKFLAVYKSNRPADAGLRWLQQLTWLFAGFLTIWLVYLVPYIIPRYTDVILDKFDWYPIYVPVTILIYWLGIKGYIISYQELVTAKKAETILPESTTTPAVLLLKKAMEEDQLFLNAALTLQMVAKHTGLPPKTISAVLNQHLYKNFNEYVNGYRINLFKEKLLQEDADQLTFAGIAYDCGFSSPATFQRVFKQFTGMSPSEFRKSAPEAQKTVL